MKNIKSSKGIVIAQARKFLASKKLFYLLIVVFVLQAAWIAVSGRFEMPFDEKYHVGIIDYFANHPNPFFSSQPEYLDQFGAVVHSPAYLYHYLLAVPWRIIRMSVASFEAQIIILRLLNVMFFAVGLMVFGKVLKRAIRSQGSVNLVTFLVIFTPIVTQVGGQVNYDNLTFVLLGINFLLAMDLAEAIRAKHVYLRKLIWFTSFTLLTLLVKHTYITLALGIGIYVLWNIFVVWRQDKTGLWDALRQDAGKLGKKRLAVLLVLLLLSFGLVFERYGLNLIRYGSYNPTCVKVIGVQRCEAFSIYRRSVIYTQNKPAEFDSNPFYFTYLWARHMLFNATSALNGPHSGYSIGLPLPLPYAATVVLGLGGLALSAVFWRKVFKSSTIRLMGLGTLVYLVALWILNYTAYLKYGRRVAVQGRYLVPLLPFLYAMFVLAFGPLVNKWPKVSKLITAVLVASFLAGGGVLTFILHSDESWYWEKNWAVNMNQTAQRVFRPIIPGSRYEPFWQTSREF